VALDKHSWPLLLNAKRPGSDAEESTLLEPPTHEPVHQEVQPFNVEDVFTSLMDAPWIIGGPKARLVSMNTPGKSSLRVRRIASDRLPHSTSQKMPIRPNTSNPQQRPWALKPASVTNHGTTQPLNAEISPIQRKPLRLPVRARQAILVLR
jgi:hypothetical protein